MNKKTLSTIILWFVVSCQSSHKPKLEAAKIPDPINYQCSAGKEFITTYNFLVDSKAYNIDSKTAQPIALKVSSGCDGAAGRFMRVLTMLTKAKMETGAALSLAQEFAVRDEKVTGAFINIFQFAFLKEYLDMDLITAINLGRELSLDYKTDPEIASEDFENFVEFCLDKKQVGLPRAQCAALSIRLTKLSEKYEMEVAEAFIDAMDFLRDKDGANLATADALKVAEELLSISPYAVENFKQVYKFASQESGLSMNRKDAVEKALAVAKYTAVSTDKNTFRR